MLKIIYYAIVFYQRYVSPLKVLSCRYVPTCSCYALKAIHVHGYKGIWYSLKRLLRCHPWSDHGFDDVPPVPNNFKVGKNG